MAHYQITIQKDTPAHAAWVAFLAARKELRQKFREAIEEKLKRDNPTKS